MRILVCPDKFKGSLPAHLVARAMSDGIRDADPRYQVDAAPMADGGDGMERISCAAASDEIAADF